MHVYPGFFHDIFHEKDRRLPLAKARAFISTLFAKPLQRPTLINSDRWSPTRAEYNNLSQPLPALSLSRLKFGILKVVMKTVGLLSDGIRIGQQTGFNSGESLNYVYTNKARGQTPLGTWFDRMYLDGSGWKAIRWRKQNLEKVLDRTIRAVHATHQQVRITDIASGPGRYLLETLRRMPQIPVTAILRDRSTRELEIGRRLASEMNLKGVTFEQGDAFNRGSLATLSPRPQIAVVSGLYELFSDNAVVLTSLRGLHEVLEERGYLIYTNQPWHPQLELIARVLVNQEGQPLIMRRRTQEEMDDLVRRVGFKKVDMETDEFGILTVSLARKTLLGETV